MSQLIDQGGFGCIFYPGFNCKGQAIEKTKNIVTTASLFILINSLSGVMGQLTKNAVFFELSNYWFLLLAVFAGGQIGNFLNLKILPTRILTLITAAIVLFVAIRMGIRIF